MVLEQKKTFVRFYFAGLFDFLVYDMILIQKFSVFLFPAIREVDVYLILIDCDKKH